MEDFLSGLPLFTDVSREKLSSLVAESRVESFAPGEVIIEYGQPGRFLGIVLEGRAEAVVDDPRKGRVRLGAIEKGDFFGEMSLMTGEPTSAHVIAETRCEVLLIPQELFARHLVTNPAAVKLLARTITDRLRGREQDEDSQAQVVEAWRKHPDPYGLSLQTTRPTKILVINCGSSSLKYNLFDTGKPSNNARGMIECIGMNNTVHHYHSEKAELVMEMERGDHAAAFASMLEALTDPAKGAIKDPSEIESIGHRVVHGGELYSQPTVITEQVIADLEALSRLAPLHNPVNLIGISQSMKFFPAAKQVAVFDTAFHHKIPIHAHLYGLPYEYYKEHGVRRYGFHGISHNFVGLKAAQFLKKPFSDLKLVTCHLGNGCSVCAIDHGQSCDTSMGLTPTEGLIMGTRCGDLDPSAVLFMQNELGLSPREADDVINKRSGLKGVSGVSNDLREIEAAAGEGERRAVLAKQVFCYRVKKYIGSYVAAMGGADAIVFTGGIGENSMGVRARACQGLTFMGVTLDDAKNQAAAPEAGEAVDVAADDSPVRILVIPTDEERMIARETIRTLGYHDLAEAVRNWGERPIPIEVSAHHVHLSSEHVDELFGCELTERAPLSQPGQYACNETVDLIGPKGDVKRVRILGPCRKESQVEISITEEFKLGIDAPVRASGHLDGTPGLTVSGPCGRVALDKGVINALRHIHMAPEDALFFGIRDKDVVKIRVESGRSLTFGDVLVRVDPNFKLDMHIDTDEANAAEIKTGMIGFLEAIDDRK